MNYNGVLLLKLKTINNIFFTIIFIRQISDNTFQFVKKNLVKQKFKLKIVWSTNKKYIFLLTLVFSFEVFSKILKKIKSEKKIIMKFFIMCRQKNYFFRTIDKLLDEF